MGGKYADAEFYMGARSLFSAWFLFECAQAQHVDWERAIIIPRTAVGGCVQAFPTGRMLEKVQLPRQDDLGLPTKMHQLSFSFQRFHQTFSPSLKI